MDVLGWRRGRLVEPKRLRQLFGRADFLCSVNRYGFISVQRFYVYAERGLSRKRVSIWIYEGELGIEYQQTIVARYRCDYDGRRGELQGVSEPRLYTTALPAPQLELIERDDEPWVKFQRPPPKTYTKRTAMIGQQLSLLALGTSALFLLALKAR